MTTPSSSCCGNQLPAGFQFIQHSPLPELNVSLIQFCHPQTGARFVHIDSADPNNLFAVAFRTPPSDSTGIAHILEHTVLCGSQRFPVRDPFFTMLKRSLNTFMNAFTAGDWTCYPFSSQNRKDFDNLLDVYLDAAFFPLLREQDFRQEGHRLEFAQPDDPTSPLTFKGVVYNEMKGAMADPASLLSRRMTRHLYPTTCYHHNSGGEPADIPDLSWEQLKAFHAEFYHPGNACFFSYGTFPLADQLQRIEERVLRHFAPRTIDSDVPPEKRLSQPIRAVETFPLDAEEETAGKSMVHLAWLTNDISDSYERLAMTLLSQLLLGNPAAPLYKALLDSGLGKNLTPGCGYHDDYRTTCFAVGLQGTEPEQHQAIEQCILGTLERLAQEGFRPERIDAAIHRLELANREVTGDSYPYSINLLFRLLGPWLHCDDPLSALQLEEPIQRLRREVAQGDFFEQRIRNWLLTNPHRLSLCLKPDKEQQARELRLEQKQLEQLQAALSSEQKQQLIDQARALQHSQEQAEDLSCLPDLELTDIDRKEPVTTSETHHLDTEEVELFIQPTNGLSYINLFLPCDHLDEDLLNEVPLFCSLLTQVGAAGESYIETMQRMEATTGGIRCSSEILDDIDDLDRYRPWIRLKGKALCRNITPLCQLLGDFSTSADFSDLGRLATVIGQLKSSWENAIPGSGHSYAARAAAALLTPAARQREQWSGFSQLKHVKQAAALSPSELAPLAEKLQRIAQQIFCRNRLKVALTCESEQAQEGLRALGTLLQRLAVSHPGISRQTNPFMPTDGRLGWVSSLPVAYVTRSFRTVPYSHPDAAALKVLAALLRANFLHREIREKGGAYGGMASSSSESGIFALLSYRDPHVSRTVNVYDQCLKWVLKGDFSDKEIKEAILSVFSSHDRPNSPAGRAAVEFANQLQGLDHARRQQYRERLLAVTRSQLVEAARTYLIETEQPRPISILAGEELLQQGQRENELLKELKIERI
ncbi:MAG: insulinase family protein [Desulfuromonadaceae bacterium]|nr:insulinase family protein [Desulfuromonadaceae bacterium]